MKPKTLPKGVPKMGRGGEQLLRVAKRSARRCLAMGAASMIMTGLHSAYCQAWIFSTSLQSIKSSFALFGGYQAACKAKEILHLRRVVPKGRSYFFDREPDVIANWDSFGSGLCKRNRRRFIMLDKQLGIQRSFWLSQH